MRQLTVLITGASAGIGEAFAKVFAEHNFDLVLVARRAERLEEIAEQIKGQYDVQVTCLPADLSEVNAVDKLMSELDAKNLIIDALVNNAGYALNGGFLEPSWEDHRKMHQVMLNGYTELCYRLLPSMVERRYGRIINVSSLSALLPSVPSSMYTGIKRYVVDMSAAIDFEMRGQGIHCLALCPGFTYTEFHDVMGVREQAQSNFPKFMWQSSETVAREGYDAVMAGKVLKVNGWYNRLLSLVLNNLPYPIQHRLARSQDPFSD